MELKNGRKPTPSLPPLSHYVVPPPPRAPPVCQWQFSKCARAAARAHSLRMNNNTLDGWITVKHGEPVKAAVQAGGAGAMRGAACVQAPPRGLFAARGASAPLAAPLLAQAAVVVVVVYRGPSVL